MTPNDLGKQIKNGISGTFLFYGEEQYLKQYYLNLVKKSLFVEGDNTVSLSGEGISLSDICRSVLELASMPSFDSGKRLVYVYNVEWKKVSEDDLSFLEDCVNELRDYEDVTTVIDTRPEAFDAGTEKKPSKLFARLSKIVAPVFFARESPARLSVWVQKHFASDRVKASPEVCDFLIRYSGRDMTTLNNEITKLSAYVLSHGKNDVTITDVREAASSVNEIGTFDFSNAVLNGDSERAFSIMTDMKLHKEAPELILGSLIYIYSNLYTVKILLEAGMMKSDIAKKTKLHEYTAGLYVQRASRLSKNGLKKAIELCQEADIKIKSTNIDSYNVLDALLIKLFMTGRLA